MLKIYKTLFLLVLPILSYTQEINHSENVDNLDSICQVIKETYDIPGLAVGLILDNKVYYSNALGLQDLESKTALTASSLFHMASVSKPFVATAIMQLVESGQINLEDKLKGHLPYFAMKDKRFHNITIKQILNHSSGIPDVDDYEWTNLSTMMKLLKGIRRVSRKPL